MTEAPKLAALPHVGRLPVPWVAMWSSEEGTVYLDRQRMLGKDYLAVMHRQARGEGQAMLGHMSWVRQRQALLEDRCQVCGERVGRRYVALHTSGQSMESYARRYDRASVPLLTEPWACATCAAASLRLCPGVRGRTFHLLQEWELVATVVRPIGDAAKDTPFLPLTRAEFPAGGAVGYLKIAVRKAKAADLSGLTP